MPSGDACRSPCQYADRSTQGKKERLWWIHRFKRHRRGLNYLDARKLFAGFQISVCLCIRRAADVGFENLSRLINFALQSDKLRLIRGQSYKVLFNLRDFICLDDFESMEPGNAGLKVDEGLSSFLEDSHEQQGRFVRWNFVVLKRISTGRRRDFGADNLSGQRNSTPELRECVLQRRYLCFVFRDRPTSLR